jgi:hypothetical protein
MGKGNRWRGRKERRKKIKTGRKAQERRHDKNGDEEGLCMRGRQVSREKRGEK